jgi:hypothetical protein
VTVTLPPAREIARDEAHHAAALSLQGMVPQGGEIDWPKERTAAFLTIDWGDGLDRDAPKPVLIAVLLGGMTEGFDGWDDWPINPERMPIGARLNAKQARHLAEYIGITDRPTWLFYVWKANRLGGSPEFRRLVVAIGDELERVDDLDRVREEAAEWMYDLLTSIVPRREGARARAEADCADPGRDFRVLAVSELLPHPRLRGLRTAR